MPQAAPLTLLERIQATSTPIVMPPLLESGTLVRWFKKPGEQIGLFESLAQVEFDGLATELTSTTSGVVKALMVREGSNVGQGDVLCYVQPAEQPLPSPAPNGKRHDPPPSRDPIPTSGPSPSLNSRAVIWVDRDKSQMDSPHDTAWAAPEPPQMEELTFDDVEPLKPKQHQTPNPKPKPKRGKTTHKTYHLEEGQVQRIKRLSLELKLDEQGPVDCNESELIRAAVEMLLELPRPALRAVIKANREREKVGRYGSGWPRPGKN